MNKVSKTSLVVSALWLAAGSFGLAGCTGSMDEDEGTSSEDIGQVAQALVDSNGLCADKWYYNHEANFNNELQKYATQSEAKTHGIVTVSNGTLKITAKSIAIGGKNYLSARLITKGKFEASRGRWEARLRVTPNQGQSSGIWPAFWMLGNQVAEAPNAGPKPWPTNGADELDIFEWASHWDHVDYNIIADDDCPPTGGTCDYYQTRQHWNAWPKATPAFDPWGWRAYGAEITDTQIKALFDGVVFGTAPRQGDNWTHNEPGFLMGTCNASGNCNTVDSDQAFNTPMFMILNLAVGGTLGCQEGAPAPCPNPNLFPSGGGPTLEVDWVRHYPVGSSTPDFADDFDGTCGGGGGGPTPRSISNNLEAESNDGMNGVQFETTTDIGGGQNGGWIENGDYIEWLVNVPSSGNYTVTTRSATTAAASYAILVDGAQVTTNSIGNTGGWQNWQSFTTNSFSMSAGNRTVRIKFTSASQNLNWIKINSASSCTPTTCSAQGKNCGSISDGCGGSLNCGSCGSGQTCTSNVCTTSCTPTTCSAQGKNCGSISDGCGGNLNCGSCGSGQTCTSNVCTSSSSYGVGSLIQAESGVQTGTQLENSNTTVGYFDGGDHIAFANVDMTGVTGMSMRVAGANSGGVMEVRLGSPTGTLLGSYTMSSTGGWATWATRTMSLSSSSGVHTLYLKGAGTTTGILNIDHFTLTGGSSGTTTTVEAESRNVNQGTGLENCTEGGQNVMDVGDGEYIGWTNLDLTGVTQFQARVASANYAGTIEFRKGGQGGELMATCSAPNTGGWQSWTTVTCNATNAGGNSLYLVFHGPSAGSQLPNLNWIKLVR